MRAARPAENKVPAAAPGFNFSRPARSRISKPPSFRETLNSGTEKKEMNVLIPAINHRAVPGGLRHASFEENANVFGLRAL